MPRGDTPFFRPCHHCKNNLTQAPTLTCGRPEYHRPRGFAALSAEEGRAMAAKGGAAVPASSRSYSKNRDLAASAGRLGGQMSKGCKRGPRGPHKPKVEY